VRITLLCTILAVGVLPALWVFAQQDARYFEETGHTVRGEFLRFYERYGGRAIFGYPLTRVLVEDGRQVQYFQRARMELYPDKPEQVLTAYDLSGDASLVLPADDFFGTGRDSSPDMGAIER